MQVNPKRFRDQLMASFKTPKQSDDYLHSSAEPHGVFSALGHVVDQNANKRKAKDNKKPLAFSWSLAFCIKINQINHTKYKMNKG